MPKTEQISEQHVSSFEIKHVDQPERNVEFIK